MKIVFFDLNRLSFEGGAENYISDVSNELAARGHEVYYVGDWRWLLNCYINMAALIGASTWSAAAQARRQLRQQPILRPENKGLIKTFQITGACLVPGTSRRRKLIALLENADLVLAKNEIFEMQLLNSLARQAKKSVLIFSSPEYPHPKTCRAKLHNFFYTGRFYRHLLQPYQDVIVSNDLDRKFFRQRMKLSPERIKKIPYGLKPDAFRAHYAQRPDQFRVLFAGRFEEQKGIDYLLKIINYFSTQRDFPKITFTVAGAGGGEGSIKQLARHYKRVDYIGLIPKAKMAELYNQHDLVIITSRWETFCYTCLEAQACGVPVVSFAISGPDEMVIDKETGRLIKPGDLKSFISAIEYFYHLKFDAPSKFRKVQAAAQARMAELFSLSKVADSLISLATRQ